MDPAAQQLTVVHGSGCKSEGDGLYSRIGFLKTIRGKNGIRQVVCVHPVDLWGHVGTVVWGVAGQVQTLVADDLLWNIDVGLIYGWMGVLK